MAEKRVVWAHCRATPDCPGNNAEISSQRKTRGGGYIIRYRCLTCGRVWVVQV